MNASLNSVALYVVYSTIEECICKMTLFSIAQRVSGDWHVFERTVQFLSPSQPPRKDSFLSPAFILSETHTLCRSLQRKMPEANPEQELRTGMYIIHLISHSLIQNAPCVGNTYENYDL